MFLFFKKNAVICIENLRTFEIKKNLFSLVVKAAIIYFAPVMYLEDMKEDGL